MMMIYDMSYDKLTIKLRIEMSKDRFLL